MDGLVSIIPATVWPISCGPLGVKGKSLENNAGF